MSKDLQMVDCSQYRETQKNSRKHRKQNQLRASFLAASPRAKTGISFFVLFVMAAKIIDGLRCAEAVKARVSTRIKQIVAAGGRAPKLAVHLGHFCSDDVLTVHIRSFSLVSDRIPSPMSERRHNLAKKSVLRAFSWTGRPPSPRRKCVRLWPRWRSTPMLTASLCNW